MKFLSSRVLLPWILPSFLIAPSFAASNDLEVLVRSFPGVNASGYRPDLSAQVANAFILAGEKASFTVLNRLAIPKHDLSGPEGMAEFEEFEDLNRKICFVCRLLYVPRSEAEPLQPPRMGAPIDLPYRSMDPLLWPHLPFVVMNGIPLSMNLGYALLGRCERAADYLAYCRSNGAFRTESFAQPTSESVSNALQQVFDSAAWKSLRWRDPGLGWNYDLNEDDAKRLLRKQVQNLSMRSHAANSQEGASR